MLKTRVTIRFTGRIQGALGIGYEMERRRSISVPSPFTYEQAMEAARVALYERDAMDAHAYESVRVLNVAFN